MAERPLSQILDFLEEHEEGTLARDGETRLDAQRVVEIDEKLSLPIREEDEPGEPQARAEALEIRARLREAAGLEAIAGEAALG